MHGLKLNVVQIGSESVYKTEITVFPKMAYHTFFLSHFPSFMDAAACGICLRRKETCLLHVLT